MKRAFRVPYSTRRAALDAVAAGKKAVMMDAADQAAVLAREATARGLALVVHGEHAYVLRLDQVWRIAALDALRASTDTWSDAAEAQQSRLLGYTDAQIAAWLARYREHQAAWGAATIYAVLDRAQLAATRALGMRAFVDGTVISWRPPRVPAGSTLVRAGLDWDVAEAVLGKRRRAPIDPRVNAGLRSRLEIRTARGWR